MKRNVTLETRISKLEEKVGVKTSLKESSELPNLDPTLIVALKRAEYLHKENHLKETFKRTYTGERLGLCSSLFEDIELTLSTGSYNAKENDTLIYVAYVQWYWNYIKGGRNGSSYRIYSLDPFVANPVWVFNPRDLF